MAITHLHHYQLVLIFIQFVDQLLDAADLQARGQQTKRDKAVADKQPVRRRATAQIMACKRTRAAQLPNVASVRSNNQSHPLTSSMFGGLGTRHQGVLPLRKADTACTCSSLQHMVHRGGPGQVAGGINSKTIVRRNIHRH